MVCPLWLVPPFGLRSIKKLCLLLSFIIRLLSITLMILRLRLGRVLSLAFVFFAPCLMKLLLMLNLTLLFLMTEANHYDGFLIILLIISPAQLLYAAVFEPGRETESNLSNPG
jgi:hypothetical protein